MYSLVPHHLDISANSSRIDDSIVSEVDMQLEPLVNKQHRSAVRPELIRDAVPFESSSMARHIPGLGVTSGRSTLGTPTKWYFYNASRQPGEGLDLNVINESKKPFNAHASTQRINWMLFDEDISDGLYDITLGISLEGLVFKTIESISITIDRQFYSEPAEIITSNDLRAMSMDSTIPQDQGAIRLKLHQQVLKSNRENKGDIKFVMDIRTFPDANVDSGTIVLHYMETCLNSFGDYIPGALSTSNQPYMWSFNLYGNGESDYDKALRASKSFTHVAVSGDGSHVVTLATLTTPTLAGSLIMEVWDVRDPSTMYDNVPFRRYSPLPCAKSAIPMTSNRSLDVAVSWNATKIALLDISPVQVSQNPKQDSPSLFEIFTYERASGVDYRSQSWLRHDLKHFDCCLELRKYIGNGRFHFVSDPGVDMGKELFVTCDGETLSLFSTVDQWSLIRHLPLFDSDSLFGYYDHGAALSKQLRGRHLALTSQNKQHVAVWNIEEGAVVSFMDCPTTNTYALSSDGLLMAFARQQHITLHSATAGTMIGTCRLEQLTNSDIIKNVSFIGGDKRIMVETTYKDPSLGPQHLGYIIDTATMTVEDRYFMPPRVLFHDVSGGSDRLVCLNNYTLDLICLHDRVISTPASLQKMRCDDHCTDQGILLDSLPTSLLVPSSGLHFKAQKLPASASSPASVALTVSKNSNLSEEKLIFQVPGVYDVAAFLESHSCLIIQRSYLLMIWKLPTTISGNVQLILVHNLGSGLVWRLCREQRIYSHNPHPDTSIRDVYLDIEHPFTLDNSKCFMGGELALMEQFPHANEVYRNQIFRYLGRHINTYPDPKTPLISVLGVICSAWSSEVHDVSCTFLRALLSSPFTRWIPRPDLDKGLNPLMIFLDLSKKDPQAIAAAEIIIDHCIDQAKINKDPSFLAPVSQSLATLVERKGPHSELALKTLRGFAYVPVSHRSYVIDHHTISYPPEECWKFWTRERSKLFQTPEPILQLSTLLNQESSNANFTRELYAASFDLLWKQSQVSKKSVLFLARPAHGQNHYSWPSFLLHMVAQKRFGATGNSAVECHPFDLKELDNPAITALVDYKWNTIGYRYWLVRFLSECCYYVLVLVAIFKQVYGDHTEKLPGLFIAVIIASVIFLWLEAVQYINNPKRYFSPTFRTYNIADLLAFLSPMLGSIYQLCIIFGYVSGDTNPGFLSFSVLFISLHMLFELRVVKSVCHFVTIIIQVIKTIRVFFFVFAGGILGFTVAILHLLRACLNSSCSNLSQDFPTHFFKSVSAVYFVMGGRYDPFDEDFKSDNWAFHLMLIVFFFFTVILMLNVLIALINLAFNNGDQTWRLKWLENRMRYVESAENMTYIVPGFRETQGCFPSTVFYSATPQEVRNYDRKTKQLIEDFAPTVARPDGASKGQGQQGEKGEDDNISMQLHFEQKKAIDDLRSELKVGIKEELQSLRDENALLRVQISGLQQQLSSLPGQVAALLRADGAQNLLTPRPT